MLSIKMCKNDDIIVSVEVLAYNHEGTIARALDSILMQKTKYKYEIVIGEDASTDNTAVIVKEYAEKYPDIIVPLIRKNNLGVQRNAIDVIQHCRGKYIAVCEGDDYWLVDDKLERQIDYLETHDDYSMSVTKCLFYLNGEEKAYPFSAEDSMSIRDMLNGGDVKRYATCTSVFRNVYKEQPELLEYLRESVVGDLISATILATSGCIHYMDYATGVYERVDLGRTVSFSSDTIERQVREIRKSINACKKITGREFDSDWDKYKAIYNRSLYRERCINSRKHVAWKYIRQELSCKDRYYLIRLLILDYIEYKNNNRINKGDC